MQTLSSQQPVPVYPFERGHAAESSPFTLVRSEGALPYEENLLIPHRKAHYLLVFVRHNRGRHWVDMTPYERQDNTLYFSSPSQVLVKEAATPFWGTFLTFTTEFLALQEHAAIRSLPLIQNPHNGHELLLTAADGAFVEEMLAKPKPSISAPASGSTAC